MPAVSARQGEDGRPDGEALGHGDEDHVIDPGVQPADGDARQGGRDSAGDDAETEQSRGRAAAPLKEASRTPLREKLERAPRDRARYEQGGEHEFAGALPRAVE